MLRAHLERKLGRFFTKALPEIAEQQVLFDRRLRSALSSGEDPLTSSVLERLSYLPLTTLWSLLQRACTTLDGPLVLPCPKGEPRWHFWPSLNPAPERERTYVEPDVLLYTSTHSLIIECKHHDRQSQGQWREQIAALWHQRRDSAAPSPCVIHLAIGGSEAEWRQQADGVDTSALGFPRVHLVYLSWISLAGAIESLCRFDQELGQRRLLMATLDALVAFGYPPRRWFRSLPVVQIAADARRVLSTPIVRRSRIGFGGLPQTTLSTFLCPWRSR